MRYAQGGGLTAEGRRRRELVRLAAVEKFEQRVPVPEIAAELRVPDGGQRLLLADRAQVEVVLQQLPLHFLAPDLDQLLQLIVGHLPGPTAGQVFHQGLETDSRAGKGVSRSRRAVPSRSAARR